MKWKLDFDFPDYQPKLNLSDPVVLMGSCFADHIGRRLIDYKFDSTTNPFGVIYNPNALLSSLQDALDLTPPTLLNQAGIYYAWEAHSQVFGATEASFLKAYEERQRALQHQLSIAKWIILSPGTSWIYAHKSTTRPVANCHKVPQNEFKKRLLSIEEITDQFGIIKKRIEQENPAVQWILTVSPVRHIRDGLVENNLSKSILIAAWHTLIEQYENCHYFPSYEIVVDELRDYRFFDSDLVHPSAEAIEYVWERFVEKVMDSDTRQFVHDWTKMLQSLQHRPLHPESDTHRRFLRALHKKLSVFQSKIDVSTEIAQVEEQLQP